jgi:uncharacterized Fe-S cluster protein YjdI
MREITKKYSNGEVTIIWKPHLCRHSGKCFTGLPMVFDPLVIPWVNPEGADTEAIIVQVKQCPSQALTFEMNNDSEKES